MSDCQSSLSTTGAIEFDSSAVSQRNLLIDMTKPVAFTTVCLKWNAVPGSLSATRSITYEVCGLPLSKSLQYHAIDLASTSTIKLSDLQKWVTSQSSRCPITKIELLTPSFTLRQTELMSNNYDAIPTQYTVSTISDSYFSV